MIVSFFKDVVMLVKSPKMVLIDLDGTLVDSVPDLAYCIDAMLEDLDMSKQGEDKVRLWVGNGAERLVRRALMGQLEGEPDEALLHKAYPLFMELYAENTCRYSVVYPGVLQGLRFLLSAGYCIACVTNKPARFTEPLLKSLRLHEFFKLVISGDSLPKKKPDPMPLLHAAKFFNVRPADSLMLGDSVTDVQAARAAGFQIICMSYGYNHGDDIRTTHPDAVIDSMLELEGLLGPLRREGVA